MFIWNLNIGTNILHRASSVRFGLREGCFFLRCVQEMEGYQAMDADLWGPWRWALKPPCQISQWLESLLRWLDQWRRERFGKGSHGQCQGDTGILGCAAGESVPSRSRLPHGSTDDGICAAPLLPSGEFSHCRGQSEWSLIHALTFGFCTVHISTKRFLNIFLSCSQAVNCWHDLDNTEYDCWPINSPNDYNMISCGGEFPL